MKSETAVQALQRGVPPEVLSQLTGDAHPTPRELAAFKESGGVSHTALGGTSSVRSHPKRARSSFSSFSFLETRLGVCVGLDTACILAGIHVDFTGEVFGLKIGASGYPVFPLFNASLRTYGNRAIGETTAPYLYAGVAYGLAITYAGGIGWDIELGGNQNVVLQPQVGFQMVSAFAATDGSLQTWRHPVPSLSLSIVGGL